MRQLTGGVLLAFGTGWLVFLPLGRYSIDHPDLFWYRTLTRTSSKEKEINGSGWDGIIHDRLPIFLHNNWNYLRAFNWRGDSGSANPGQVPLLDWLSGGLLLGGVILLVIWLIRYRDARWSMPLIVFPILALSSTLALAFPGENPSASRSSVLVPVVLTAAAIPITLVIAAARRAWPGVRFDVAIALATLLLFTASARANAEWYFHTTMRRTDFLLPTTRKSPKPSRRLRPKGSTQTTPTSSASPIGWITAMSPYLSGT